MKKTTVINLFGSPGSGKSTFAADLFSEMKKHNYEVEMVREWVKLWAWEGRNLSYADQIVVFGNQVHEETALYGKVDFIITDSPLILSAFYENIYYGTNHLLASAKNLMKLSQKNNVRYLNVLLKRDWAYQSKGRFQTEAEAQKLDEKMIKFLKKNKLSYEIETDVEEVILGICNEQIN